MRQSYKRAHVRLLLTVTGHAHADALMHILTGSLKQISCGARKLILCREPNDSGCLSSQFSINGEARKQDVCSSRLKASRCWNTAVWARTSAAGSSEASTTYTVLSSLPFRPSGPKKLFAKQSFLGDSEPPVNHHSNPNASSSLVISQTVSTKQHNGEISNKKLL